ncbi:hypothetical protein FUSO6_08965 [Fusobacterium necrophorum DAB]|uniref:Coenzyme F420 hydrogenase/dehydrogenase, beta subunit C-terminal domain n=1 Tax=Fusobacterium necrophorum TaxID=859 RepID=UPI000460F0C4|nr:Coenzyme F420 hydrogenase/dehydrogenase, beta subunit C-terminal domain [Fusobacterium necrophorum]KDE68400.1 hypothetical protein FUSO6_08965 [Fusobacterium necrophorum DAB]
MKKLEDRNFPLAYGVRSKDKEILNSSSSGGFFSELANHLLKKNVKIYGCILDENLEAIHIRGKNKEDIKKMRTSKYVESNLGNIFKYIRKDLNEGNKVLVVSSPCYVNAIKKFLNMNELEQVILVDFLCHGMPDKKIFKEHIKSIENYYSSEVKFYSFRDKRYGWNHDEYALLANGKKVQSPKIVHRYKRLFHSNYSLVSRCFKCKYTTKNRGTDFTIADFWGIEKVLGIVDNKGMSAVMINTKKAFNIFRDIEPFLESYQVNLDDFKHGPLHHPTEKPKDYNEFWEEFEERGYLYVAEKYAPLNKKILISTYRRRIAALLRIENLLFWLKYKIIERGTKT